MTKPNFTSGPWRTKKYLNATERAAYTAIELPKFIYPKASDCLIAEVVSEQDAHLIATAPELLQQCELFNKVLHHAADPNDWGKFIKELNIVLAKARDER